MSADDHTTFGGPEIAGYVVERKIGRGGMGVVYQAVDPVLRRRVAIKVIADIVLNNPKSSDRFIREARALASIHHRNVLPIHHVGSHEGRPFLVMHLVQGHTLRDLLQRRPLLAPGHAFTLMSQIGAALDALHHTELVHGDVKPENVLLEGPYGDEHAWLADFGLARYVNEELTASDQAAGTFWYMAPEQLRGDPGVGPGADLYSLALVLYECLLGERLDIMRRRNPAAELPHDDVFTAELRRVFTRALAIDPTDRYESAGSLMAEVRAALRPVPLASTGPQKSPDSVRSQGGEDDLKSLDLETGSPARSAGGRWTTLLSRHPRRRMLIACAALVTAIGGAGLAGAHFATENHRPRPLAASGRASYPSTPAVSPAPASPPSPPSPGPPKRSPAARTPLPSPERTRDSHRAASTPSGRPARVGGVPLVVCGKTVTVRAQPGPERDTTVVATLTRGETFIMESAEGSTWAQGYAPAVPGARGWVLRQWVKRTCS